MWCSSMKGVVFPYYPRAWKGASIHRISGNGDRSRKLQVLERDRYKDTDEDNAANAKAVNKNNWKETSVPENSGV